MGSNYKCFEYWSKSTSAEGAPTAVSRAAGMALTKALAGEFAKDNILVNALLVGLIDSNQHLIRHQSSNSTGSMSHFWKIWQLPKISL